MKLELAAIAAMALPLVVVVAIGLISYLAKG